MDKGSLNALIITIGDELLIGQTVNTNAAWIGSELERNGISVVECVTVGDDLAVIEAVIREGIRRCSVVITTGGLGPTRDDLTREAISACFSAPLVTDATVKAFIIDRFDNFGIPMPLENLRQALVPTGFKVLANPVGTAPGLWRSWRDQGSFHCIAVLPGVPFEMKGLMDSDVIPRLCDQPNRRSIVHRTLHTTAIGESSLQERLGEPQALLGEHVRLASLPGLSGVSVRLSISGRDEAFVREELAVVEERIRSRIGRYIYGADGDTLESAVGRLLVERRLHVGTAESCTAGLICHRLTNVPGSSAYVRGGIVAYANDVKVDMLGVDAGAIETHGAVSEAVVRQMAEGARRSLGADIGIATSGIMGPGGGSDEKSVGTVWIALAQKAGVQARRVFVGHDRVTNKERAATAAIAMLWKFLTTSEREMKTR